MLLSKIKVIDLKRSKWNKEKSNPRLGIYAFDKKVYVVSSDYTDPKTMPRYRLAWVRWDSREDFASVAEWKSQHQATFVNWEDEDFWPEGLTPNASGNYVFQDVVLMKIPISVWVEKVQADQKRYDKAADEMIKAYEVETEKADAKL
jgi:hypothetical protein